MAHLTTDELTERVAALDVPPMDNGTITALVLRPEVNERKVVQSIRVKPNEGIEGDNYVARGSSKTPDGGPHPEAQICMMRSDVLNVFSDGDEAKWPLAGDQMLVDFDLSTDNLPTGTELGIGSATFRVVAKPHNGCQKFSERYGLDARRFANSDPVARYRGIYIIVLTEGEVSVGDTIAKI